MGTPVDPLGWAILAVTAIGTGAQVYGTMQQSALNKGMAQAQARAANTERMQADLQATQISAQRMQELNANVAALNAMRAGRNTLGDSPTAAAIIRSFTRESLGARANEVLDARLRALSARNAMWAAQETARAEGRAGPILALGQAAQGAANMMGMFYRPNNTTVRRTAQRHEDTHGGG